MIFNKPKFWDKKINLISFVLLPLSCLYLLINFFKKKFAKVYKFKIPIICLGNIYIGGTGKTPLSILLASELSKSGKKISILRRYHKSHEDEYNLIKNNFKNLIINKDRILGIKEAERDNCDYIVLDDGLQDYRIHKKVKIVCFNSKQLIGNGLVLPSGPLRERLSSLKNSDIIIINGNKNEKFEKIIYNINKNLKIFYSSYQPKNIEIFKNKELVAIAGIGNPENFFELIEKNNLTVKKKIIFPDHYKFSRNEIQTIVDDAFNKNYQIIMTEKDYYKIIDYKINGIDYLKIDLIIENKENFISLIKELCDENN